MSSEISCLHNWYSFISHVNIIWRSTTDEEKKPPQKFTNSNRQKSEKRKQNVLKLSLLG